WNTRNRTTVLNQPPFLVVEQHAVELPDGRVIEDWPWIITPDFINIMVEMEDGRWLFFRQTKYAIEGTSLAPVGGYIDAHEEPLVAAQRELREETGCMADEWLPLGSYAVDGNRGAGRAHFFMARRARKVAERNADDLEEQELLFLSREEVAAALAAGEFKVLPWAAIVALALTRR
ncbi:MAG TPA: NUDIX hydrolase, partial [Roseiflexaceae bacterium]|nr:NUDIX hydrolase [Roseiflexaceae bacterium]